MQNGERSYAKRRAVSSSGRVIKGVEGRSGRVSTILLTLANPPREIDAVR